MRYLFLISLILMGGVAEAHEGGKYLVAAANSSEVSAVLNTETGEIWYTRTGIIRPWGSSYQGTRGQTR